MINGENPANGDDRSGWCVRHNAGDWQILLATTTRMARPSTAPR